SRAPRRPAVLDGGSSARRDHPLPAGRRTRTGPRRRPCSPGCIPSATGSRDAPRLSAPETGLLEAPLGDLVPERGDDLVERDPRCLDALAIANGVRPGLDVTVPDDDDVRHLHQLCRPDLLADRLLRVVDERAQA